MPPESAPSIGAQTRVSIALIDITVDVPFSGLPTLDGGFVALGCTRDIRIKFPSQPSKPIPCGLVAAQWMVPGREELGTLDIQSLDFAEVPDDILAYNDLRTVAKLETENEEGDIVRIIYAVDWRPVIDMQFPDGDGETMVSATGAYSRVIIDNSP